MATKRKPTKQDRYILAGLIWHGRDKLHCTQQEVADGLGCSLRWISDIERGRANPTWKDALHLFILLGIDLNDFAEKTGVEPLKERNGETAPV